MARVDGDWERRIAAYTAEIRGVLGTRLVCLALHGSAAGDDFVPGRSDVNTVVVVGRVNLDVLDALAPIVARFGTQGFALPLVADREYLERARDTFPIELDDMRRRHRLLAGEDLLATVEVERAALRRECEVEARGKLVRLRALYLEAAGRPDALEPVLSGSLKTFLLVLRELLRLHGREPADGYGAGLAAGEELLGPLPTMRRLLAHREGAPLDPGALRAAFGPYLGEVERLVAAVDAAPA